MQENRRNFSRVQFTSPVFIISGDIRVESSLMDISLKGALVSLDQVNGLVVGDEVELEFHLNDTEIVLNITAKIVYSNDSNLGLKFDNIDLEGMIHLRRLVELNIGDPDQIQKELFFLVSPR